VNFLEDKNRTKELVEILVTSFDLNFILLFILLFYFLDSPDWSVFDFFIFWTARRRGFHGVPLKFEKVRVASYHHQPDILQQPHHHHDNHQLLLHSSAS